MDLKQVRQPYFDEEHFLKVWTSDQETQPAVTTSRPPSVTPSRPPSVTGGVATSGVSSNPNIRSKGQKENLTIC
jgi:hypothetical protein